MAVQGIVFDCDGVLFASHRANLAYYNLILNHFGESPVGEDDRERCHLCHTAASPEVFRVLLGAERLDDALTFSRSVDYRQFLPEMIPEPGLVDALAELSRDFPLAVATNRGNSMVEILEHFRLGEFFAAVVTSRDVERPKPYPDMLHLAARRLGIVSEDLLFVGDSDLDRLAAREARMPFVAYRGHMEGALRIDHHQELRPLVTTLNGGI